MKSKNTIRILVLAALAAWPGVELLRLKTAQTQLHASTELRQSVEAKFTATQVKYAQASQEN